MNSLIEQAALRLQQLREAGADLPDLGTRIGVGGRTAKCRKSQDTCIP